MGYDVRRFIREVDDEFHCPICTMVLENPVQSPCEHIFCKECIEEWQASDLSCPVDQMPLEVDDLVPAARYFRNMLCRLELKCDFVLDGCKNVVQLEHLNDHIKDCEYNANAVIVCNKGCNLMITRREYEMNNCFSHLADQLNAKEVEISELRQELTDLKANMMQEYAKQEEILELKEEMRNLKLNCERQVEQK